MTDGPDPSPPAARGARHAVARGPTPQCGGTYLTPPDTTLSGASPGSRPLLTAGCQGPSGILVEGTRSPKDVHELCAAGRRGRRFIPFVNVGGPRRCPGAQGLAHLLGLARPTGHHPHSAVPRLPHAARHRHRTGRDSVPGPRRGRPLSTLRCSLALAG